LQLNELQGLFRFLGRLFFGIESAPSCVGCCLHCRSATWRPMP